MPTITVTPKHDKELQDIADTICRANSVLVVTGAGISTNSGIPDFRSAGGLYNLVKSKYPNHAALVKGRDLFDSILFSDPTTTAIFYTFLAELRQKIGKIKGTTPTHKFIKTLSDTGRLLRCYTQNIDGLEALDGMCMDLARGAGKRGKGKDRIGRDGGCEVVRLHGDLERLRCTACGILTEYNRERTETLLDGQPPECPDCSTKANDRVAAGKRSIHVGSLRPNIVLYDEPHPQAELIGRLTHHDATRSCPDLLLVFGTSLKVLGLKRLVKVFASKIHSKGGKVIYINNLAAAESTWGEVLDYHIQMDCDDWVTEMKVRRKEIWEKQSKIDWKNTKPGCTPVLKSRKSMSAFDHNVIDKENNVPSLKRRKSTSALTNGGKKEKGSQLPSPELSPHKQRRTDKFDIIITKQAPSTPSSKRRHQSAFPTTSSPLSEISNTPSSGKRQRLNATNVTKTPKSWTRFQDHAPGTPKSPGSSCISIVTTPGTRHRHSLPTNSPLPPTPSAFSILTAMTPSSRSRRTEFLKQALTPTHRQRLTPTHRDHTHISDTDDDTETDDEFFDAQSEGARFVDPTIESSPVHDPLAFSSPLESFDNRGYMRHNHNRGYLESPYSKPQFGTPLGNISTSPRRYEKSYQQAAIQIYGTPPHYRRSTLNIAASPEPIPQPVFSEQSCSTKILPSTHPTTYIPSDHELQLQSEADIDSELDQVVGVEYPSSNTTHSPCLPPQLPIFINERDFVKSPGFKLFSARSSPVHRANAQLPTPPSSQDLPEPVPAPILTMAINTSSNVAKLAKTLPTIPRSPYKHLKRALRSRRASSILASDSEDGGIGKSNTMRPRNSLPLTCKTRAAIAREEQALAQAERDKKVALRTRGASKRQSLGIDGVVA